MNFSFFFFPSFLVFFFFFFLNLLSDNVALNANEMPSANRKLLEGVHHLPRPPVSHLTTRRREVRDGGAAACDGTAGWLVCLWRRLPVKLPGNDCGLQDSLLLLLQTQTTCEGGVKRFSVATVPAGPRRKRNLESRERIYVARC